MLERYLSKRVNLVYLHLARDLTLPCPLSVVDPFSTLYLYPGGRQHVGTDVAHPSWILFVYLWVLFSGRY